MKGCYLLIINLPQDLQIKKWFLKKGTYVYIGSAMNNIEKRVTRHLSKKKKMHWHIDYLLEKASVEKVLMISSKKRCEEKISNLFSKYFTGPKGFGSSDLNVFTNLYRIDDYNKLIKVVSEIFRNDGDKL